MLILAGVSISAIVGEDGVISKAQYAKLANGIAILQDYVDQFYLQYHDEFEDSLNRVEAFQNFELSKDWIYNPSNEGYGSSKYIVNADGKAIYLFNKNNLPEEVQNSLVGGNAKDGSYYNYYNMNDVYGITSNLKVYYCENGSDTISGINYNELDQDNPSRIVIESGSKLSNLLNDGNEMSLSQVKTVNTLTIDENSGINTLKDLYILTSLTDLTLKNITLDSLDGIENATILKRLTLSNCTINNSTDSINKLTKLEYLYLVNTNDILVSKILTSMQNVNYNKLSYMGIYSSNNNVSDASMRLLDNLTNDTKKAVTSLYINNNNISSVTYLKDFVNLKYLDVHSNLNLKSLKGLKTLTKLQYLYAQSCNLGAEEVYGNEYENNGKNIETNALGDLNNINSLKYINLQNNTNLKWISYLNNSSYSYMYLNGCSNLIPSEVKEIKNRYNAVSNINRNIDSKFLRYLSSDDIYNYGSINLDDTSVEINELYTMSEENKLKVKVIDLSNNTDLSDAKINEVLSSGFTNAFSIRLNGCRNLKTLDFLQYTPNIKELLIGNTSVAQSEETKTEIRKIDTYCNQLRSLTIYSDYIDILDIKNFVVRCGKGLVTSTYYANWYNYFRCNSSTTKQLGKITEFTGSWRIMGMGAYTSDYIDMTGCTITSLVIDGSYVFRLPSTLISISDVQSGNPTDISRCVNLKTINVNPGLFRKEVLDNYFKQIYDNSINSIETINVSRYGSYNVDIGDTTKYLCNSGIKELRYRDYQDHSAQFKGIFDFNDNSETEFVEFGNLKTLIIESCNKIDTSCVKDCKTLNELSFYNCNVNTTENFVNLTNLKTLTLDNNNISDVSGLKDLTQLETLYIRNNCLYDDALKIFLNMNQNGSLKNLYISGNSSIIDTSILNQGNWEGKDW